MITKIELKEKFSRGFKPFTMIPKPGVNLLVGENGSGKSSLIYYMLNNESAFNIECDKNRECYSFDTEVNNPRTRQSNPFDSDGIFNGICSHFKSHGETIFPILEHLKTFKDTMIFLDEPESGVSIGNQLKLYRILNKAVRQGCQFFIATHSYILIKKYKYVFDLKVCKFVKSSEWLEQFKI